MGNDYEFELELRRGDSKNFKFKIKDANGTVIPKTNLDTLFVTCREKSKITSPIIFQKDIDDITYSDNYYHVQILPEDTEKLEYGRYDMDIESTTLGGFRKTKYGSIILYKETTIHSEVE